jgi:uncharacterized FAD-dependent dehydrogenase
MLRITELKLPIEHSPDALKEAICHRLNIAAKDLLEFKLFRRGYDARKRVAIQFVYTVDVRVSNEVAVLSRFRADKHITLTPDFSYHFVARAPDNLSTRPVVIGLGPAGLFAGLVLAQMGFRPLILERGKSVRERTQDTWGLWRKGLLISESNVQFGEGGAGTFSDGKLYSQIKDPKHYGRKVIDELILAGAPEEIAYVSKPHIGTFRLVGIVEQLRHTIQALGGEIRFQSRVVDIVREENKLSAVILDSGEVITCSEAILAIGHSARDTFEMLYARGVDMEAKPFSVGVRIEHPQGLIDRCRLGNAAGHPELGAADYRLVHHASNGRAVYSFCMCPGGTVVAAASEPGMLVTNGMSQYSRNERNANSAIVVNVTPEDYPGHPLAGIAFQRQWESRAFELGGSNYHAPIHLLGDFLAGRTSTELGDVQPSYQPGVTLSDLSSALPDYVISAMREALQAFDKELRGFALPDAVLTGVETRTSSPVRIRRNEDDCQSINTAGLYPTGEGAGYAGGILSAAIDGIRVAEALALRVTGKTSQQKPA